MSVHNLHPNEPSDKLYCAKCEKLCETNEAFCAGLVSDEGWLCATCASGVRDPMTHIVSHTPTQKFLKSKYYPVNSDEQVIYNDPQRTARDCEIGRFYDISEGTIAIKGSRLIKFIEKYNNFTVSPPRTEPSQSYMQRAESLRIRASVATLLAHVEVYEAVQHPLALGTEVCFRGYSGVIVARNPNDADRYEVKFFDAHYHVYRTKWTSRAQVTVNATATR